MQLCILSMNLGLFVPTPSVQQFISTIPFELGDILSISILVRQNDEW